MYFWYSLALSRHVQFVDYPIADEFHVWNGSSNAPATIGVSQNDCPDVTARGYHKRTGVPVDAFVYDWFASKAIDGSLPMGPGITPAYAVPDPHDLRLRLWVNDELQQDESTADMICGIDELVSAASSIVTLEPGDIICTGTPSGVGAGRGLFLRPGDVVRVAVDGLGEISNRVIDAEGEDR